MNFEDILRIASGLHKNHQNSNNGNNNNNNNDNDNDGTTTSSSKSSSSSSSSSSLLSLKQLVPVHQSLLETININNNNNNNNNNNTTKDREEEEEEEEEPPVSVEWLVSFLLTNPIMDNNNDNNNTRDESLVLCRRIILGDPFYFSSSSCSSSTSSTSSGGILYDDDKAKLLAWQYLLQKTVVKKGSSSSSSSTSSNSSSPPYLRAKVINPMDWFSDILLKFFVTTTTNNNNNNNNNTISKELTDVLLELSLELIFASDTEIDSWMKLRAKLLNETIDCLAASKQSSSSLSSMVSSSSSSLPISSKIVMKIVLFHFNKQQQHQLQLQHDRSVLLIPMPYFISMYYEHLWHNIEFASSASASATTTTTTTTKNGGLDDDDNGKSQSSNSYSSDLLSEISKKMILPMLKEFQQSSKNDIISDDHHHVAELTALFQTKLFPLLEREGVVLLQQENNDITNNPKQQQQHLLLIATTILCPFLPWYWKQIQKQQRQQQQQQGQRHHEQQSTISISKSIWELIYTCLQQGRRSVVHDRGSGGGNGRDSRGNGHVNDTGGTQSYYSSNTSFGISSLLRRRALYLLDVITNTSNNNNNNNNNNIWKDYILCAETFEMECERHIIDQLWPVVIKLIRESYKNNAAAVNLSEDNNDMDTNGGNANVTSMPLITSKWIELLLGRIVSSEQLAVRKLGIFRLLQVLGRPISKSTSLTIQDDMASASIAAATTDDTVIVTVPMDIDESDEPSTLEGVQGQQQEQQLSKKKAKRAKQKEAHHQQQQKKKQKKKKGGSNEKVTLEELSTELLLKSLSSDTFLWDVLVPAWDSLGGSSVGYTMHIENTPTSSGGNNSTPTEKYTRIDMVPLFCQTIQNYTILAINNTSSDSFFWKGLWDYDRVVCHLSAKTLISVYSSVTELFDDDDDEEKQQQQQQVVNIPMDDNDLKSIRCTFTKLFETFVLTHRKQFLHMLSLMLSKSRFPVSSSSSTKNKNWNPINVLSLFGLFSPSYFPLLDSPPTEDDNDDVVEDCWTIEKEDMLMMLGTFIRQFERQQQQPASLSSSSYAVTVGATLASAFVTGQVSLSSSSKWTPVEGSSVSDQELGWAVALFCTLAVVSPTDGSPTTRTNNNNAGELLWPAIHKGLSQSASAVLMGSSSNTNNNPKADAVARGLLLLENGCRLRQISGLGNGDLVVNPKTQQIMPPPPNIELLLKGGIDFIKWHIRVLLETETHAVKEDEGGTTTTGINNNNKRFTGTYAYLISQLKVLHQSYPSSHAVSSVMNELLKTSFEELSQLMAGNDASSDAGDVKKLLLLGLIYGACTCGAEPEDKGSYVSFCRLLLRTGLSTSGEGQPKVWVKSSRSIIQYARWAAISCILPKILEASSESTSTDPAHAVELDTLIDDLLEEGIKASSITPSDAIKPLFDCIVISSRRWICASSKYDDPKKVEILYIENLTKIIKVLLSLIKQSTRSRESAYMLNDFCALIFQAGLLREEYDRIQQDPACSTPIRCGFRQLIKMAGRYRPHVTRAVLCRITVAWMGDDDSDDNADAGVSAIPYRDDIVQLLLHKEAKKDESASNQSAEEIPTSGVTEIPANTNYLSITRAFLLVFFTRLPGPDAGGLNPIVKTELTHHVILALLQQSTPEKGTHPKLVMKGTPTYCMKIRGWQALCIMSRFVTNEVAQKVCTTVFDAMNELLHSQIRYFLENFTIKCATNHQDIFGEAFLKEISRTDLSLQHISSLMILGGNFIMGKYQLDYFTKHDDNKQRLKRVLAGAIPWLSSTQGFSRAIAQLMVYQLIPKVVDVTTDGSPSSTSTTIEDSDWFLKSTYNFLDQNREMKRLRSKQTKFFERYDCDKMCTPEGVFSIQMDEALEANPVHLIDAMKESLRSTYDEAHESDAPSWKQVEELMTTDSDTDDGTNGDDNTNNMIQRKIIPLDSLNLALEDLREQRLTNAKGSQKQELIVCASLVDKIPNLGGLARSSEIFAAQSLIVPDLSVTKMDIFQSISVGAADWIDIQEVKEEALLLWLLQKKTEGYWIVGLEQTSSSAPLHQIEIPTNVVKNNNKTILLLGKEKEGIPVQFLQAVDACIEIPQFGMIRSLNVHVSGAITIWELTRRTRLLQQQQQQQE